MILLLQILQILLDVAWWIIVVQAILSWLIAFNVVNTRNEGVRTVWNALNRMTEPFYRPIRRILPDFGSLDLSPLVVLILIAILDKIIQAAIVQQLYGGALGA